MLAQMLFETIWGSTGGPVEGCMPESEQRTQPVFGRFIFAV